MIYCGYQGTGKSTYCRAHSKTTIDLDSSNFKKGAKWEYEYVNIAKQFSDLGKDVFISAHPCVIEHLIMKKIKFKIIIPCENKDAWQARLWFRYYQKPIEANLRAVQDFIQNWDKDMQYYLSLEKNGITVLRVNAKMQTNLEELL